MSSVQQLAPGERLPEANPSDSFVSSGSDWDLLGDLMIDLGEQTPLKMQNASVENMAPKPDAEKSLKMKIKRKSKNEEKHEIVTPDMEKHKQLIAIKAEDGDTAPNAKKARVDKLDSSKRKSCSMLRRDASTNTSSVGTSIEPDSLGPCETGTSIGLDGIVWLETTTGVLVVNVTWRGRTYVGTLLDSSQHDFAPPCPKDYVPPMEIQRNARGRGKRRGGMNNLCGARGRRLGRQLPLSTKSDESDEGSRQDAKETSSQPGTDLPNIRCPELGCDKRYFDLQSLKWHHIRHHCEPKPYFVHDPSRTTPTDLQVEKSVDGSSVFKVPQAKQRHQSAGITKGSPPKTVTVSKTCAVPQGMQQQKCKREDKVPQVVGPFKPIQPKMGVPEVPLPNGAVAREAKEPKKKRQSPSGDRQPPSLAPKQLVSCHPPNGNSPRKGHKRSDPVSPAYSDISDEGSAPVLEKEETSARSGAPAPVQRPKSRDLGPTNGKVVRTPSRGSPNAPQKPSLGHSPSEDSKQEERRQILVENSDIKEPKEIPRPQPSPTARAPAPTESPRRPGSRQSAPMPPPFVSPLPPSHFHPGFDYRFLNPAGPLPGGPYGMPGYPMDKTALEALNQYAAASARFPTMQHKIHELGRSASPSSRKVSSPSQLPPGLGPYHRAPAMDPFTGLPTPPYSVASSMLGHPSHHFLPPK